MTPEPLMTATEVGEMLGFSSATVLDWYQQGRLPGFKVNGKAVRFRRTEVEAWLQNGRQRPQEAPRAFAGLNTACGPSCGHVVEETTIMFHPLRASAWAGAGR